MLVSFSEEYGVNRIAIKKNSKYATCLWKVTILSPFRAGINKKDFQRALAKILYKY